MNLIVKDWDKMNETESKAYRNEAFCAWLEAGGDWRRFDGSKRYQEMFFFYRLSTKRQRWEGHLKLRPTHFVHISIIISTLILASLLIEHSNEQTYPLWHENAINGWCDMLVKMWKHETPSEPFLLALVSDKHLINDLHSTRKLKTFQRAFTHTHTHDPVRALAAS